MRLFRSIFYVFLLCMSFLSVHAQTAIAQNPMTIDSAMLMLDSRGQDSLRREAEELPYVFPNPNRPHKLLDQLREQIEVKNGDFVKWITHANKNQKVEQIAIGETRNIRPSWVLYLVCVLFMALALVRFFFPTDFYGIIYAYYDERVLQQLSKEDNMVTSWPYIFLYIIFSFALGLFIVVVESTFVHTTVLNLENYLRISVVVSLLFILKVLFIRFISFVFQLGRISREYIAVLYLVYFNSMLFLMLFLLIVAFLPAQYFGIIFNLFAFVSIILFLYRFLRTAFVLFGNLRFSIFYLILYLCVLEIAPVLILVRTLSN